MINLTCTQRPGQLFFSGDSTAGALGYNLYVSTAPIQSSQDLTAAQRRFTIRQDNSVNRVLELLSKPNNEKALAAAPILCQVQLKKAYECGASKLCVKKIEGINTMRHRMVDITDLLHPGIAKRKRRSTGGAISGSPPQLRVFTS